MIRFVASIRTGLNPLQQRVGLGMSLVLLCLLLMTGCGSNQNDIGPSSSPQSSPPAQSKVVNKEGNYITASPNPVKLGGLTGKTMVSWGSQGIPPMDVHIWVHDPTGKELGMFATGSVGSQEAPWISAPTEFRLVSGSGPDKKTLASVVVTVSK